MIFAGSANAQTQDDKIYERTEVDEKPKIIKKTFPSASDCERNLRMVGIIELRAVLRKSGEVTDIEVVQASPCAAFNKSALKAVKKIKFKPAVKDGQPVSVLMPIAYSYSSY